MPWVAIGLISLLGTSAVAGAPASPPGARVDETAIGLYSQDPAVWLSNGRTYAEQRYSPLQRVDARNVSRLGLAWQASLESPMFGVESTPIFVDGVLYTTSSYSRVFAFDARTGALRWKFDPRVSPDRIRYGCCYAVNRGPAIWKGRVYVAAYDGRLIALDAASGTRVWEVNTTGEVPFYTITGAPRIADGKVIIGNAGSDFGTRGFVSAYDAATGQLLWRFYVVPGGPDKPFERPELAAAALTWDRNRDWSKGGDGNPWDSISYDPETKLLYVGTGNGGWVDQPQNVIGSAGRHVQLFVSSILAIHIETGSLAWYYQTTPGDMWDYDATQNMVLADLEVHGHSRKVLMQASKNGFYYVLDRVNGELISATPYVYVNWTKGIDPKTGRPIPNPAANYAKQARHVFPAAIGGHNWPGMAFDPKRRLAFIPARESGFIYSLSVPTWFEHVHGLPELTREQAVRERHGALIAWDPVNGKPAWQAVLETPANGGVLATAGGLVVQGTQAGYLRFYSADSGKLLHELFTGTGIVAPPITYELDGEQYFAFEAGWSGFNTDPEPVNAPAPYANDARLVVLKVDGGSVPVAPRKQLAPFLAIDTVQDRKLVSKGAATYLTYCAICHGHVGEQTLVPDLRRMSSATYQSFDAIAIGGALRAGGMASFADVLNASDTNAVRAFIVDWAQRSRRNDPTARQMPATASESD